MMNITQLYAMVANNDFDTISDILATIKNPELLVTALGMLIDQWAADTGNSYEDTHAALETLVEAHANVNATEGAMEPRPRKEN